MAILTAAPQLSMGAIAELLPALLLKLAAAKSSPLIVALLTVVAHLVHASATELIDYLANAHNPGRSQLLCSNPFSMQPSLTAAADTCIWL